MGALTSKPYAFIARPWELIEREAFDIFDIVGSSVKLSVRGREIMRILPNVRFSMTNEWIADVSRFSYDAVASSARAKFLFLREPSSHSSNRPRYSDTSFFDPTSIWLNDFLASRIGLTVSLDHFCLSYAKTLQFFESAQGASSNTFTLNSNLDFRFFPKHQVDKFYRALNLGLSALFLFDFNVRYSIPSFAIKIRQATQQARHSFVIFNVGPAANNLLGEVNLVYSAKALSNFIRFKSRVSRFFTVTSTYSFFGFSLFSFYSPYISAAKLLNYSVFFTSPRHVSYVELGVSGVTSQLRVNHGSKLLSAVFSTYTLNLNSPKYDIRIPLPHPYEDSYTYFLDGRISTRSFFSNHVTSNISSGAAIDVVEHSQRYIHFPFLFKLAYYESFSPSPYTSFFCLGFLTSSKPIFNFTNYITHFLSTQFQENSINILLNTKRHNEFRSNYIYYL